MANYDIELRSLTFGDFDTPLLELPIVFSGLFGECCEYARKQGYVWKASKNLLFGGYFAEPNGNCLIPT